MTPRGVQRVPKSHPKLPKASPREPKGSPKSPQGHHRGSIWHSGGVPWPTLVSRWELLVRPLHLLGASWAPQGPLWRPQATFGTKTVRKVSMLTPFGGICWGALGRVFRKLLSGKSPGSPSDRRHGRKAFKYNVLTPRGSQTLQIQWF